MISKVMKAVSISREISDDISINRKLGKSFSCWVEEQYTKTFLSVKSKREKLIRLEEEMNKLKEIIKMEEESKPYLFFGFCPCCGEPIKNQKEILNNYILCSFCYTERLEEATNLIQKIKEYMSQ